MTAQKGKKPTRGKTARWAIFHAANYWIFLAGALVIVAGYVAMMQGPYDSFWSLHLAPVLLVIGYCVLIPLAILLRIPRSKDQ